MKGVQRMKVAITGGSGFLGNYVADAVKEHNHTPIILTRKSLDNVKKDEYRNTNYTKNDLSQKLHDIDAVVHLAAKRGSQGFIAEFHDNEIFTQNLYEACSENGITNIVFASTISVYSDEGSLPWTEKHLPSPYLMYGISKLSNEHIGNIYSEKKSLNIKNLRLAHLYGFNEKNNYMINRFFRQAFHQEQLILNTKSVAKREFLYAKDAAKAIICALKQNSVSGTFNIGSGEAFTNLEVAEKINSTFGNDNNLLVKDHDVEEGIQSSYMDSGEARRVLNFSPNYTFTEALAEIYLLMRRLDDVPLWY